MPHAKQRPSPEWREFEALVARIEQVLAGTEISIISPDRVRSLITGRKREVDASIRTRVGSADILVTIECRKRKSVQDVTWIEQLGTKKQAIGAARTIAVASSAFSTGATRVAAHYGIDLRVLSDVSDADLQTWILPTSVIHVFKECSFFESPQISILREANDDFSEGGILPLVDGRPPGSDAKVFLAADGSTVSLNDLWLRADDQLNIFDRIPTDDKTYRLHLKLEVTDDLRLQTPTGARRVNELKLALELRWKHEELPLRDARVVHYRPASPEDQSSPQVRAEFESQGATGTNIRLGMQFEPGKPQASFTLQLLPGKK